MPYVRTVRTSSGAIAVQIVRSCHRGARQIEHGFLQASDHTKSMTLRKVATVPVQR
jgi:hypothetical protein